MSHKSLYLFRSSALCLALVITVGVRAVSDVAPTKSPEPLDRAPLTFVQITDLHLFDAGIKANNKSDAEREQSESREALRWAIAEINHLIDSGVDVSFVVFSGDLGLYAVRARISRYATRMKMQITTTPGVGGGRLCRYPCGLPRNLRLS